MPRLTVTAFGVEVTVCAVRWVQVTLCVGAAHQAVNEQRLAGCGFSWSLFCGESPGAGGVPTSICG